MRKVCTQEWLCFSSIHLLHVQKLSQWNAWNCCLPRFKTRSHGCGECITESRCWVRTLRSGSQDLDVLKASSKTLKRYSQWNAASFELNPLWFWCLIWCFMELSGRSSSVSGCVFKSWLEEIWREAMWNCLCTAYCDLNEIRGNESLYCFEASESVLGWEGWSRALCLCSACMRLLEHESSSTSQSALVSASASITSVGQ